MSAKSPLRRKHFDNRKLQRIDNCVPLNGIISPKRRLDVLASGRLLNSSAKWSPTAEEAIDPLTWAAVKKRVVSKDHQTGGSESSGAEFLGKRDILAETEHLLRILAIARIFQLDGISQLSPVRREYRNIDLSL